MAFAGLHVACGYYGAMVYKDDFASLPVMGKAISSENPATNTLSTLVAPAMASGKTAGAVGQPIFRVRVSADTYVAIGTAPDPTVATARHFQAANTTVDYAVAPGDKLKWQAVP